MPLMVTDNLYRSDKWGKKKVGKIIKTTEGRSLKQWLKGKLIAQLIRKP